MPIRQRDVFRYINVDIKLQRIVFIVIIILSSAVPLFFVRLDEPTVSLNVFKFIAKIGALGGTMLIVWQFLLGYRSAVGKVMVDLLWVLSVHKNLGKYIMLIVGLHPVFITLYYLEKKGYNPLVLGGPKPFRYFVLVGMAALTIFIVVIATSILWRQKLAKRTWFGFHITAYIALPMIFLHSFPIGSTISEPPARYFWIALAIFVGLLFAFRVMCRLGFMQKKYIVTAVTEVGPKITRIDAAPLGKKIVPGVGQFIYLRKGSAGNIRPFTVSHYDEKTAELSVTVKALGATSTSLQSIRQGELLYIDGPYGIFSHEALKSDRPLVMIAGGIGITPFTRIFEALSYEPKREHYLFYGNRSKHEIIYEEELENSKTVNVIHVLSEDSNYPGETGYITISLLKKYLTDALSNYEFLVCGPPVMTMKLEEALAIENVPYEQIHHELFSY